jgi:glutamate-1-semialdehyde 2,1-aminomutase
MNNQDAWRKAKALIPGGTHLLGKRPEMYAPEQWPPYYKHASGCEVTDLDGRLYVDFTMNGIGSCLLGYAHPAVTAAVVDRIRAGSMSSLNCPEEIELAELLIEMHPWAEQMRMARTGGEAMAVAVRILRAATKRDVIAFCGYHGWADWYLAANLNADSALDGHLIPGLSPAGVPRGLRDTALPFTYNEIEGLERIVRAHGDRLAAVVMEPTRIHLPRPGFLEGVRSLCDQCGARLAFDEVTTGFRLHQGGVHLKFGVEPDMAIFAKALGNGHPIAAVIGKANTMQAVQDTFMTSTYWTEAIGPTAAVATLRQMAMLDLPARLARTGDEFRAALASAAKESGVPLVLSGHPALTYFSFDHPQANALMTLFTVRMLKHGFLAGAHFYPTLAHESHHIDAYVDATKSIFPELAEAIATDNIAERIGGPVKQTGFARLA